MDKQKQARYDTVDGVVDFMELNRAIWAPDEQIEAVLGGLRGIRDTVRTSNASFVNGKTTGNTLAEYAERDTAIDAVLRLTNVVTPFAMAQKDQLLYVTVKCEATDLIRLNTGSRIDRLNQLFTACSTTAPNIPGCKLTAEDFRNARVAIDNYVTLKTGKSKKNNVRKSDRVTVAKSLKSATPLLQQMELLVRNFAYLHPDFWQQFKFTRRTAKPVGRKQQLSPEEVQANNAAKEAQKAAKAAALEAAQKAESQKRIAAAAKRKAEAEAATKAANEALAETEASIKEVTGAEAPADNGEPTAGTPEPRGEKEVA